jgi:hypothetical protein
MIGDWAFLVWIFLCAIPPGLALAAYWAHGLRRHRQPKVPPGDPGNPT